MIKKPLLKFFKKFGIQVSRVDTNKPLKDLFNRLQSAGINLATIWDIGAYKGEWTKEVSSYCPESEFRLFEPNSIHNKDLMKTGFPFHNYLLGKKQEEVKFFSEGTTGDSIYPEYDETRKIRTNFRTLQSKTIDNIIKDENLYPPTFIKLDVQGAELDVLQGAKGTLNKVSVLLLECPILTYNWGSPNISDYLDFMYERKFIPFYVTEIHRLTQIVTQIDIAFVAEHEFDLHIKSLADIGFWQSTKEKYQV